MNNSNSIFNTIYNICNAVSSIAPVFLFLSFLTAFALIAVIFYDIVIKLKEKNENKALLEDKEKIKDIDYATLEREKRANIIRTVIASDGIDPNPLNTLVISDGGKEIFERSFTLIGIPKKVTFANTFAELLNYDNCTSSVHIIPMSASEVTKKMDDHMITLEGEYISAAKKYDSNRIRKIGMQYRETEDWASKVERGDNSFYKVGFVFTLRADSFEKLNIITDEFHSLALQKGLMISSCYGVQSEAYLSNSPCNEFYSLQWGPIKSSAITYHPMDKLALSTIFNHTQSEYSHKEGVFLGRNMHTQKPITFDIYDGSHSGYTLLMCGKTGCGKSVTVKIMVSRYLPFGYRFVGIDSQPIGASGEYACLAEAANGVNFLIKAGVDNIMNIFEVGESLIFIKEGKRGKEIRTLELLGKITQVTNTLLTMIQGKLEISDFETLTYVQRIVVDSASELYDDFGIYDGNPDSLYEDGQIMDGNKLTSGKKKKKLPIITDFYKKILYKNKTNDKEELKPIFNIIISSLKDFVKELIYSVDTLTFFTKEEYLGLPVTERGNRYYVNSTGQKEKVEFIRGIRSYFDGQSTISITNDCPFTNFDISQLSESEKVLARQIAIDFVNELFVKKNSENLSTASKLVVIIDEAHENFAYKYARETIDNEVRTARKKNVSIWLSTQSLAEYDRFEETKSILRNAAVKFIYKQDYQDREYIKKSLHLTDAQVDQILELCGDPSDKSSRNARRGEVCICDNTKVCFCKVDYLKETEQYVADTDPETVKRLFTQGV